MANPPAGSTPIYHLPWPGGPNPAEGPTGFRNLAQAIEPAIGQVRGDPNTPWCFCPVTSAVTVANGANSGPIPISIGQQSTHGVFFAGTAGSNSVATNRPGMYRFQMGVRTRLLTGTANAGGWNTLSLGINAALLQNWVMRASGLLWCDFWFSGLFRVNATTDRITITFTNSSGATGWQVTGGQFWWNWINA
jgi:hypothetical protein